jgi:hypothetical protein
MSVSFNGTSSKLVYGANVRSAYPFSMFCWIKPANATASMMVGGSGNTGGGQELAMQADGSIAGDPVKAFSRDGASSVVASSTSALDASAWQPALVVFTSTTSRTVYYAGGAAVTNTTNNSASPNLHNRFVIGTRPYTDSIWFAGDIAEVAIWSDALTQSDFDALAAGDLPETVQAGSLIDAWPLLDNTDLTGVNARTFTATSVTNGATHPISRGGGGDTINCNLGSASATGYAASILAATTIACALGSADATGYQATVTVASATTINCNLGTASAVGYQATITSVGSATITSSVFKNNTGTVLSGLTVQKVWAIPLGTPDFTNVVTDGSGIMSITDGTLSAGDYLLVTSNADGSAVGVKKYTAA